MGITPLDNLTAGWASLVYAAGLIWHRTYVHLFEKP